MAFPSFITFVFVGFSTNAVGFFLYFLFVAWGGDPKAVMTSLYFLSTLLGFTANSRLTFKEKRVRLSAFFPYMAIYLFGYVLQLSIFVLIVDVFAASHVIAQFVAIPLVAVISFVLQRYIVFGRSSLSPARRV